MITVGLYGIPDTTGGVQPTYTHDHSVALMRDGRVIEVIELERWTGRKHDNRLPTYITEILAKRLPADEDVRFVSVNAFVGSSFVSADGNLRIEPERRVEISAEPVPAEVYWYPDGRTRRPAEGWVVCHEAAHLGALLPFVGRFEDGALAAHIDGGASRSACSFWVIEDGMPVLTSHSWELLKDIVNNFNVNPAVRVILGFQPHEHLAIPGKLMGYAALGTACDELDEWLQSRRWLLGLSDVEAARAIEERLGTLDARMQPCRDFCATLQRGFEREVTRELTSRAERGSRLYFAGGAALNIPTNAALQEYFGEVWVPPATNDSGLALGAAAWIEYRERRALPVHGPFLSQFDSLVGEPDAADIPAIANCLLAGDVIGVCNGAAEVGPRALGHRSIIARADSVDLRVRVIEQIKRREWYRPVAPILCAAAAREVLEMAAVRSPLSRWMLGAWQVRPAWRRALQGVLHGDGSVRAQVVRECAQGQNRWMHDLLTYLWEQHEIPALINTSFNGPGQPIVQRLDDAATTARALGLDGVVMHGELHRLSAD